METIEKKKLDGSDFMMGMVVDSSMRLQHKLVSLLREYEAKNIENVPVATLNQMVMESGMEAIMPGGLVSSMMKYSQIGE